MSLPRRQLTSGFLGMLLLISSGCRTPVQQPLPTLPPPTAMQDGSPSYQVGPEHPLAQQAAAIRAAAETQPR